MIEYEMTPALQDAIDAFIQMVAGTGPGPWNHFTCSEVEAVTDLLDALGEQRLSNVVVSDHAEADEDPDDMHYRVPA